MAGILFTDGKLVLAGYDLNKKSITGIGGKKQGLEFPFQTGLRETIEEIFELEHLSPNVLRYIEQELVFDRCICYKEYTTFIMSFHDLEKIMKQIVLYNLKSKVYPVLPETLSDLILKRKPHPNAELKWIILVPNEKLEFSKSFLKDLETFNSMKQ